MAKNHFLWLPLLFAGRLFASPRFPKPDFESGYEQPMAELPSGIATTALLDTLLLFFFLMAAAFFALHKRSRRGLFYLAVAAAAYFGFYREGCICPVGSIQNMVQTLFIPGYTTAYPVIVFFMLPLVFALICGRVFCSGVCPLGAVQELLIWKPQRLPLWLRKTLGFIPYVYLSAAVLYASTGSGYLICRFDPFVSLFRMSGPFYLIMITAAFLLLSLFIARPYCRFLCPYSVLLRLFSRVSFKHLKITAHSCVNCGLCTSSCPLQVINVPQKGPAGDNLDTRRRKFLVTAVAIPLICAGLGFGLSRLDHLVAMGNPDYNLTNRLELEDQDTASHRTLESLAFRSSGRSRDELREIAAQVKRRAFRGLWIAGLFLGLVMGLTVLSALRDERPSHFEPDRALCVSCGRCMECCPLDQDADILVKASGKDSKII